MLLIPRVINAILDDVPRAFHLPAGANRRKDVPLIPRMVVREAVVNALMHRSYRQRQPVQVIRYANRLEIRNPGHSLIPEERLGEPGSLTRNDKIAAVLHETAYAENKGSGIRAMREALADAGLTPPTFESDRESDRFVMTLLFHHFLNPEDLKWLGQFKDAELSEDEAKALVFAREVGAINNAAYRDLNRVETLVASGHLRRLRDAGLLDQKGKSAGTYYVPTSRLLAKPAGLQGLPTELTPAPTAQAQGLPELPRPLQDAVVLLGQRATPVEVRGVVRQLCAWHPLRAEQISRYLKRQQVYVTRTHLTPMIRDGELEYLYPDQPAHPQQAYRTKAKSSGKNRH